MIATRPRNSHAYAWVITFFALLELALIIAMLFWFRGSTQCTSAATESIAALMFRVPVLGPMFAGPGGAAPGGGGNPSSGGSGVVVPPIAAPSPAPQTSAAVSTVATGAPDTPPSGSLKDVPDPNCVGHQAASLLNSDQATAQPTCGSFSAPPELKAAASSLP
jgi:hypothetical protein